MSAPPDRIIRAFGRSGLAQPLAGGRGTAWRVGNRVLKPADISDAEIAWQAQALATARPQNMRLVVPLRSADGAFIVEGWVATPYVEAVHEPGRWLDVLEVGRRLGAALAELPRPAFLDARRTAWDIADRVAWGEEPIERFGNYPHIDALIRLRHAVDSSGQVIHGDLTGNVLFPEGLAPAVIDFATYWRPSAYAGAIVVADGLVWEGAPDELVDALDGGSDALQLLVRALLFRAVVEILRRPPHDPESAARPFAHAVDVVRALITPLRRGRR